MRMPRRRRANSGGVLHHVLNRASRRSTLFAHRADYEQFLRVLADAKRRVPVRLVAFAIMPNHWHMIVWPREDLHLSQFMHWLTMTHTQRWHTDRGTTGTGPLYQGRYKAIPVQSGAHFLTVARYVERNPVRGGLVRRADDWPWSSAFRLHPERGAGTELLDEWPMPVPIDWAATVNREDTPSRLEAVREAVRRSAPFGDEVWREEAAARFATQNSLRPRGRPCRK
jgi:putative transposase